MGRDCRLAQHMEAGASLDGGQTASLPVQCPQLKPNVRRQPGVKGACVVFLAPCRRRHFRRGTAGHNGCPPCGTGVGDSPLALQSRRVGEGAYGTLSAFGHGALQISLDGQASGGQEGVAPLHPPPGYPWTQMDYAIDRPVLERKTTYLHPPNTPYRRSSLPTGSEIFPPGL